MPRVICGAGVVRLWPIAPWLNPCACARQHFAHFLHRTAAQKSQPFGIETQDEYNPVHTNSLYDRACMQGVAAGTKHYSALEKDPVSCALMSDLLCGGCRWPSWVCAYVSGTNLFGELKAQRHERYRLNCRIDHSLSHHAVQRLLPDQAGLRPPPAILRGSVTLPLALRPQHHLSDGRPPCASSPPRRCAPSCWPTPPSPA